jgi:hypothetical protein
MNSFYEFIGYISPFCNYVILYFFFNNRKKISLLPFNFFFINIIISTFLDAISLYLHYTEYQGDSFFYKLIMPLYAVNNILLMGIFSSYYVEISNRKTFQMLSVLLSIVIIFLYFFDSKTNFSTWGTLTQTVIMLIFLLSAYKNLYLKIKHETNRKSALIIITSWIIGFILTFIIFLCFNNMKEIQPIYANLLYGIQTIFWIIVNILSAYAIYKIVIKPTSSPKP